MSTLYPEVINVHPGEDFKYVYETSTDLTASVASFLYRTYNDPWEEHLEDDVEPALTRAEDEENVLWTVTFFLPWDDFITAVEYKTMGSWLLNLTTEDVVDTVAYGFWKRGLVNA